MRLPMNVRRIATVAVVCSAVVAGGSVTAWGHDHDRHDKQRHHQKHTHHYEKKHWWAYLSDKMGALTNRLDVLGGSMNGLAASLTSTLTTSLTNALTIKLNDGLAAMTAQLDTKFGGLSDQVNAMNKTLINLAERMTTAEGNVKGLADNVARLDSLTKSLSLAVDDLLKRPVTQGGGLGVFDASGARVGDFVGFDPAFWVPLVAISADGHTFVLRVQPGGLQGDSVYFTSQNCSGDAYVAPSYAMTPSSLSLAGVWGPTAYVTNPNEPLPGEGAEVTVWSQGLDNGGCLTNKVPQNVAALRATQQLSVSTSKSFVVK